MYNSAVDPERRDLAHRSHRVGAKREFRMNLNDRDVLRIRSVVYRLVVVPSQSWIAVEQKSLLIALLVGRRGSLR